MRLLIIGVCPLFALFGCNPTEETFEHSWEETGADERASWVWGDFNVTHAVPIYVAPEGEGCLIVLDATFAFSGRMEGAFDAIFEIDHQGGCMEPAFEEFVAEGEWAGEVKGTYVEAPILFVGSIDPEAPPDANASGLLHMDGDEAQGLLWLEGMAGVEGDYVGIVNVGSSWGWR